MMPVTEAENTTAQAKDPVCGMLVDPARTQFHAQHDGTLYHFCSSNCKSKFEAHPQEYVTTPLSATPKTAGSAPATEYFCPMHPEVVRNAPGVCPKCGMALEPRAALGMGEDDAHARELRKRFVISLTCTVPVAALALLDFLPAFHELVPMRVSAWLQGLLAGPVVFWGGVPFYRSAWAGAKERTTNMYTLITIGVLAAYLFSLAALIAPRVIPQRGGMLAVYFDTAAIITTLILLGEWLQGMARGRTTQAIRKLAGLQAKSAHVLRDRKEMDVPLADVRVGDLLRVKPGEIIPTDGVVIEGTGSANEAMITGESQLVRKAPGSPVIGATIISGGSLVIRADKMGDDTLLGQIMRLVAEAQSSRAPMQRLADRISGIFVPVVILVAVLTFVAWLTWGPEPGVINGLVNAVAVLIIACPCALGLATPMAVTAAVGRGAQMGILIKNGESMERASMTDVLVVDKTGTLTEGKPQVIEVLPFNETSSDDVLTLAAAVEQSSEHPLASAILEAARSKAQVLPVAQQFETVTGQGVRAVVSGATIAVGSPEFLRAGNVDLSAFEPANVRRELDSATRIAVARNGQLVGIIFISDPIRATSRNAIQALAAEHVTVVMASGDRRETAESVAAQLNIQRVHAPALPQDKVNLVKELQGQGRTVMFAGDGINDAPALAQANVGIAMASGTDIAMASADITILHGDLMRILGVIRLSRSARRIVRQNLFWAFIYNIVGVPIAAGVLYPYFGLLLSPIIASVAMSFSSLSVVFNSLRLRAVRLEL